MIEQLTETLQGPSSLASGTSSIYGHQGPLIQLIAGVRKIKPALRYFHATFRYRRVQHSLIMGRALPPRVHVEMSPSNVQQRSTLNDRSPFRFRYAASSHSGGLAGTCVPSRAPKQRSSRSRYFGSVYRSSSYGRFWGVGWRTHTL
jgi:hypothetical protein